MKKVLKTEYEEAETPHRLIYKEQPKIVWKPAKDRMNFEHEYERNLMLSHIVREAVEKVLEIAERCRKAGGSPLVQIYGGRVKITCMGGRGAGHWFKYEEIPRDIMTQLVKEIETLRGQGLKSGEILEKLKEKSEGIDKRDIEIEISILRSRVKEKG